MSRNIRNVVLIALLLTVTVIFIASPVLAQQYGGEKIGSALDRITDWLTRILGATIIIIGIIVVGIRMSLHDEQALQKGIWVVVGGLLIFLAKNILALIKGIAGI